MLGCTCGNIAGLQQKQCNRTSPCYAEKQHSQAAQWTRGGRELNLPAWAPATWIRVQCGTTPHEIHLVVCVVKVSFLSQQKENGDLGRTLFDVYSHSFSNHPFTSCCTLAGR